MKPRLIPFFLLVLLFISSCQPTRTPGELVEIDPSRLQEFADSFFPRQMKKLRIPGVAFIFIQHGKVLYASGYGVSNLEQETPVDPDWTVMPIASISKTFVATAVMQQVEQGRLDLHADVNRYLTAFQIDATYPDPVTLAALLTHTAGLEDPPYVSDTDPLDNLPLRDFLAARLPPRTHPVGETYSYCSICYDLAAFIVEEVSGRPFNEYVAENILKPLGMDHSRYLIALPAPENIATGYLYEKRTQVPQPLDFDNGYPSGSMVSTAADMSHFLLAQLQEGCYDGSCILKPETLALMHQAQAPTPYEGQSVTFGFVEGIFPEGKMLGHSGATRGFGSLVQFLPEHDMGFFIVFNQECLLTEACTILHEFRMQFLKQFLR